ncbi:MAG: YajQ family cyclic di-GMP-binding protein [Bdellovibrionales bacterium]|nr:YajQ family cyclic di-GMP-binding protein [Bdellovibrionales bacterium]
MPSFDVVSAVDMQEVKNAVDQVQRELANRYDFKGSKASIELKDALIIILSDDEMKHKALQEVLKQKLAKRNVSLKSVEFKETEKAGGDMLRQEVTVKESLSEEELKKLNKLIKNEKLKVSVSIQGDQLRIAHKQRDMLQDTINFLKEKASDLPLQFTNFRD